MARRGRNEGNVYKRSDGRWEARVQVGYRGGHRIRKSFYGRTRQEVQQQLTRALHDQDRGLSVERSERQTVAQYLKVWLEEAVAPSVRPKTLSNYEMFVRVHLSPGLGSIPLAKLAPQHVQAFLNSKLTAGLSARTVHHMRAVLRRALNQAVRWDLVARNAAALSEAPRVPRREVTALSPDEARRFLDAARHDRLFALYVTTLSLGLRQGEALGLQWSDLDLDHARLTVRHALQRVGGRLVLVEPKSRTSVRTITLPAAARDALQEHRRRQLEERLWSGSRWHDSQFVFTTTIGTPLDGSTATHRFQALLKKAGLPRLTFHSMRHSCATFLLIQGVPARVVMDILGHSQISLTMNTYSHVLPSLHDEAAARMDQLLSVRDMSSA